MKATPRRTNGIVRLPWTRVAHPTAGLIHQSAELEGEQGVVVAQDEGNKVCIAAALLDGEGNERSKQVEVVAAAEAAKTIYKHKLRLAALLRRKYWRRIGRPLSGGRWLAKRPQSSTIAAIIALDDERSSRTMARELAAAAEPVKVSQPITDADLDSDTDYSQYADHAHGGPAPCETAF